MKRMLLKDEVISAEESNALFLSLEEFAEANGYAPFQDLQIEFGVVFFAQYGKKNKPTLLVEMPDNAIKRASDFSMKRRIEIGRFLKSYLAKNPLK